MNNLPPFNYNNQREFKDDLEAIAKSKWNKSLMVQDDGKIVEIGWKTLIWENVRGIFGKVNHAKKEYVEKRFVQMLNYGKEKKLITNDFFTAQNNQIMRIVERLGGDHPETFQEKHPELDRVVNDVYRQARTMQQSKKK